MKKIILMCLTINLIACASYKLDEHVEIIGNDVQGIEIQDIRATRVNNLLLAQGIIYNSGYQKVAAYYRCKFVDNDNFQVGTDEQWQLLTIYSHEKQAFKCKASTFEASDFKIEFSKNANNVTIYH